MLKKKLIVSILACCVLGVCFISEIRETYKESKVTNQLSEESILDYINSMDNQAIYQLYNDDITPMLITYSIDLSNMNYKIEGNNILVKVSIQIKNDILDKSGDMTALYDEVKTIGYQEKYFNEVKEKATEIISDRLIGRFGNSVKVHVLYNY
ncbi:MAG: hypothetical protein [Bacteriophage sp.]|nr:MAG: hypothetical protein [Bacteriophage sp.]